MGPQSITALMDGLVTMTGFVCLVYYSINRKWAKDHLEKVLKGPAVVFIPLLRYRVELIIMAVLVPQWADWLPKLLQ